VDPFPDSRIPAPKKLPLGPILNHLVQEGSWSRFDVGTV